MRTDKIHVGVELWTYKSLIKVSTQKKNYVYRLQLILVFSGPLTHSFRRVPRPEARGGGKSWSSSFHHSTGQGWVSEDRVLVGPLHLSELCSPDLNPAVKGAQLLFAVLPCGDSPNLWGNSSKMRDWCHARCAPREHDRQSWKVSTHSLRRVCSPGVTDPGEAVG
jgi:hypothetical protein